jgi:hypothetical protein
MKKKLHQSKKITLTAFVFAAVFCLLLLPSMLSAFASFSEQNKDLPKEDLHLSTLAATKQSDSAEITFLTHGQGGDDGHWSNNFKGVAGTGTNFAFDPDSLIEKIRRATFFGIKLFRAILISSNDFALFAEYSEETEANRISKIDDFSQHIFIVFSFDTSVPMPQIYENIHYAIDKISYDFMDKMGCLPSINLIGHSMGGLLNLSYAMDHPKNTASIVSLGTPYDGSWYDNDIVNLFEHTFTTQPCLTGACSHAFCNPSLRRERWNNVFALNPHINFHALSGEIGFGIMESIIWRNNYLEDYLGREAATIIRSALLAASPLHLLLGLLPGDGCVDTLSQKATGYNGVKNYNKNFTVFNCNIKKCSKDIFPFPHNLETYDADMHNYILNNLSFDSF